MNFLRASLALSLVVGVGCVSEKRDASKLLSLAATVRHTEVRLPGAPYVSYTPTRASSQTRTASADLSEAEAILLRRTGGTFDDPKALVLLSRVGLLRKQWDDAVERANIAYELDSGSASDAGAAYLARGLALRNPRDLQLALERLGEALALDARQPEALFNRTIAYENLFLYRLAAADCRAYLELDQSSGWSNEARQRLERVERILTRWQDRFAAFAKPGSIDSEEIPAEILAENAIADWLPQLTTATRTGATELIGRLNRLATRLRTSHHDLWLSDLLAGGLAEDAIAALGGAVRANRSANRDRALALARLARQRFEQRNDIAGSVRARAEEVYALSRAFRPGECMQAASELHRLLNGRRYVWIEAQLELERAACRFHAGQFAIALQGIRSARDRSTAAGYHSLSLRAFGLESALHTLVGNLGKALELNWRATDLFWTGTHQPNRAFQLYSDLYLSAERQQLWRTAHSYAREAADLIALGPNRLTEAMARTRLAGFALRIGEAPEALSETKKAALLVSNFQNEASALEYKTEHAIVLANAYIAAGQADMATQVLSQIGNATGASVITRLALRRAHAAEREQRSAWAQARQAYLEAVQIAQSALSGLRDDAARLRWKHESDSAVRSLARIALDIDKDPEAALRAWEWLRSAPVRSTQAPPIELTADSSYRDALASHTTSTVVSWAEIGERVAIWLYDNRGVRFAWSPVSSSQCRALSLRFARQCARRDSNIEALRKTGQELYRALFEPVSEFLDPARALLVEPDTLLGAIPHEALVNNEGKWLGLNFTIVTSPGLWAETGLRGRQLNGPPSTALLVGNPAHIPLGPAVFEPLPDAALEVEAIARMLHSPRVLLGPAATRAAVTAAVPRVSLFHFAGHGSGDGDSQRLLLAGEGATLDAEALAGSVRECKLAVLSACSVAAGGRSNPWNAESFIHALWRSGTPEIVSSRWEVDSRVTSGLFQAFYAHRLSGKSTAASLRLAVTTVRDRSETAHPYYWAAFHLFGCAPLT